jgi:hypothetical protein
LNEGAARITRRSSIVDKAQETQSPWPGEVDQAVTEYRTDRLASFTVAVSTVISECSSDNYLAKLRLIPNTTMAMAIEERRACIATLSRMRMSADTLVPILIGLTGDCLLGRVSR